MSIVIISVKIIKYYVGKKNDIPMSGSHERGWDGTEICEGGI